jgi:hypothetical protein
MNLNKNIKYTIILPQEHFTDSDKEQWQAKQIVPSSLTTSDIQFSNETNWNHSQAGNLFPDLKNRKGTLNVEINIRFANGTMYHYPVGTNVLIVSTHTGRRYQAHPEGAPVNGAGNINWDDNMLLEGRAPAPTIEVGPIVPIVPIVPAVAPVVRRTPTNRSRCAIQGGARKYLKRSRMNHKNKSRKYHH